MRLFEDGFELGDFSLWDGVSASSGGEAAVVEGLAFRGKRSGKFAVPGVATIESASSRKQLANLREVYARCYVNVAQTGIVNNDARVFFIQFRSATSTVAWAGWRKTGGVIKWHLLIRDGIGYAGAYSDAVPMLNRWYCVELYWKEDAAAGIGRLYVDGQLVCEIINKNTANYGDCNQVNFGITEANGCTAPSEVYEDQCAIAQEYIGPEGIQVPLFPLILIGSLIVLALSKRGG
jgi:hypothetical protein